MLKVELIDYTGKGRSDEEWRAANLLLLTKDTRLSHGGALEQIAAMSEGEKIAALKEMTKTIPSSWEFIDVTFRVDGVSRACAQQIMRTRTNSYAMQSLRVVDASDIGIVNPFGDSDYLRLAFDNMILGAQDAYRHLRENGAAAEDARAILPLNTETSLMIKANLRSFVEMVRSRESLRTQEEYRQIIAEMKKQVIAVWPWSDEFFVGTYQLAIGMLEAAVAKMDMTVGGGVAWEIAKAIDLLRKG